MSVPYERYEDEIQIEDHERSGSESDPEEDGEGHERRLQRAHDLFSNRWPKQNGIIQIAVGFVLTMLGLAEVIIIPLAQDKDGSMFSSIIRLNHANCYGLGIWAGVVLTLTGSLGLRASMYRSISTVYMFFTVILLDVVIFTTATIFMLIGYSKAWTTRTALQNDWLFGTHVLVSILVGLSFLLIIHSFTQYYEDVFCGELQLCKRSIHLCCPCWCPAAVTEHELLENEVGNERPPSLPV